MPRLLRIGIVGCGAIGSSLAGIISKDFRSGADICGIYDLDRQKAAGLRRFLRKDIYVADCLTGLIKKSDLIIEATAMNSSYEIARQTLEASRDIMILSVGGIIARYLYLVRLARKKGGRIYIPSGAICGVDGVKAAAMAGIKKVILTTRKPPGGFRGVPYIAKNKIRLEGLKKDRVIFQGNAISALKNFPQNINVAATLSISGLGPEKTIVRIIASPNVTRNTHEVEVISDSGRIVCRSENVIHPSNPKTSYLAVLSAAAMLRRILHPLECGT